MKGSIIIAAVALALLTQNVMAVTPRAAEDALSPVGTSSTPVPRVQKTVSVGEKGAKAAARKRSGAQQRKVIRKRRH